MRSTVLLDPARLERADTTTQREPFPFMVAHGQLPPEAHTDLDRDFPRYSSAGFFPYDPGDCGPAINTLIDNLTSRAFASVIGQHLGIETWAIPDAGHPVSPAQQAPRHDPHRQPIQDRHRPDLSQHAVAGHQQRLPALSAQDRRHRQHRRARTHAAIR